MSKIGRNKLKCQSYRNSGRRQINKDLKAKKHEARIKHFLERRENGKCYEYQPPKNKKEQKKRRFKNVDRRTPIAKLDSIFSKLDNEIQAKKLEEKNKNFNKKKAE